MPNNFWLDICLEIISMLIPYHFCFSELIIELCGNNYINYFVRLPVKLICYDYIYTFISQLSTKILKDYRSIVRSVFLWEETETHFFGIYFDRLANFWPFTYFEFAPFLSKKTFVPTTSPKMIRTFWCFLIILKFA